MSICPIAVEIKYLQSRHNTDLRLFGYWLKWYFKNIFKIGSLLE